MKNFKVSTKLMLSFGIVIAMLIASMAVAIFSMQSMSKKITYYAEQAMPGASALWTARRAMVATERAMYRAVATDSKAETEAHVADAQVQLDALTDVLLTLDKVYSGDPNDIVKYRSLMDSTEAIKETIFSLLVESRNEEALALIREEYSPAFLSAGGLLVEIADGVDGRVQAYSADAEKASLTALIMLFSIALISIVVAVTICILITKSIRAPVVEIEAAAKQLARGDLSAKITYTSKDELGSLAENMRVLLSTFVGMIEDLRYGLGALGDGDFTVSSRVPELYVGDFTALNNSMGVVTEKLNMTLAQINDASDQVSGGSNQVSSSAQALSQGATEQASAVEELAATITEISQQINQTAGNAMQASEKSTVVGTEIMESNQRMNDMVSAMADISRSSSEIGKIIKTIEDIAFQTNILALNAAVEAARAGAAGKGFAVVADEVRNLASKSAEASKNTAALIESSLQAVSNGTKIAGETAKSLQAVVEGVREVSTTIDKISDAAKEQANSIAQVSSGVDQISAVVQTNSATAEESAAASEELSGQANMLKSLVATFRLKKGGSLGSGRSEESVARRNSAPALSGRIELGNHDKY